MTLALPEPGALDDADLAVAAARGDRNAFAAIYDRYSDRLYDFCAGMLRDGDAAADCVQDVFVDAATQLGALRDPMRLRSWLYAIARNHALARIRARKREMPSDDLPDVVSGDPDLATLAARSELADLIAEACGALSERDRTVFELTYRHGLDGHELAEALGVSHTNANTLTGRLRDGVERSLGALLVCRGAQADPSACPELAALLEGWDGHFTVLMRKRVARHIDGCSTCEAERVRRVNPVALLGGLPVFVPAPALLRERTLSAADPALPSPPPPTPPLPPPPGAPTSRSHYLRSALIAGFVVLGIAGVAQLLAPLRTVDPRVEPVTIEDAATSEEVPGGVTAFTAPSRPEQSAPSTVPTVPPEEPTTAITNAPTTATERLPTTRAPGPTSTTRPNASFEPSRRPETTVLRTTETTPTETTPTSTVTSTSSSTSSSSSSSSTTTSTTTSDPIE